MMEVSLDELLIKKAELLMNDLISNTFFEHSPNTSRLECF